MKPERNGTLVFQPRSLYAFPTGLPGFLPSGLRGSDSSEPILGNRAGPEHDSRRGTSVFGV